MSDFPFGGGGDEPAGPAFDQDAPSTDDARRKRLILMGGGGIAVLALAGGAYLLLSGGGGSSDTAATGPVARAHPRVTTSAKPGKSTKPAAKPTAVGTFKGSIGRDPFKALVTAPPTPTSTTPASPTGGVPVVGPTAPTPPPLTQPTTQPVTQPTTHPTTPAPVPTQTTSSAVLTLRGISFAGTAPQVTVVFNGKPYVLSAGQTLGTSLKVLSIQPDDAIATFEYGDLGFDMHVGDTRVL